MKCVGNRARPARFVRPFVLGLLIAGCTTTPLRDQMKKWDDEIQIALKESLPANQRWNAAYGVMRKATFEIEADYDREQVEGWRRKWDWDIRRSYLENLRPALVQVRDAWEDGSRGGERLNLAAGDAARKNLLMRMDGELPAALKGECMPLVDLRMGSDRNLARMKNAYRNLIDRLAEVDLQGGSASVKKIDEILANAQKVGKWHDKVDEFMKRLSERHVVAWANERPATYKRDCVAPMEGLRDRLFRTGRVNRWAAVVNARKADYRKVAEFTEAGRIDQAMKVLASHDVITRPPDLEGVPGTVDFNDVLARNVVANGKLGREVIRKMMLGGLSGVQYVRRAHRGPCSVLVIATAPFDETIARQQRNRRAFKVATQSARQAYSQYIKTFIDSVTRSEVELQNGESFEAFKDRVEAVSKMTLNNMVLLARCVKEDEVVVVLGWRDPELGTPIPGELEEVDGDLPMEISPAVGAYL